MIPDLAIPSGLPDPERAALNIETFLAENPGYSRMLEQTRQQVALLFSHSQFLATYCIHHPGTLFEALEGVDGEITAESLRSELLYHLSGCKTLQEGMKAVRVFKKSKLLAITLRDVLRRVDFVQIMRDLSSLAEAVIAESLPFVESNLMQRYGEPEMNAVSVLALGKLGARELNYSSDVDLIFVYLQEGETKGFTSVQGTILNSISSFEYYCKLVEEFTRFLSSNTDDGFAYRVDLRLRPQGQRGSLALSLRSYEEYYEAWGQLWERAALLRSRPVGGDLQLGERFVKALQPFIYRKYLGFDAIDEIRRMKGQVEQLKGGSFSNDIKRGYGGIREIEFFIQVFQLMYGGKEPLIRQRSTLRALHRLLQKGMIGYQDAKLLSDNYLFLRLTEHRIQQLNDTQTHSLPGSERDLEALARKMGFDSRRAFLEGLTNRRRAVREIYDSLLQTPGRVAEKEEHERLSGGPLSNVFWDMGTPIEHLLTEELSKTALKDVRKGIHCLTKIRNTIHSFQTFKGRHYLEDVLPRFIDEALKGPNPDLALTQLVDFSTVLASHESYLEVLAQRHEFVGSLAFFFSQSEYLSRILMSNPLYLDSLMAEPLGRRSVASALREFSAFADRHGPMAATRIMKRLRELRLGMLFITRAIDVIGLMKGLSNTAEAVLISLLSRSLPVNDPSSEPPLSLSTALVIAFGKLGGREVIFNSDLDITIATAGEPSFLDTRAAEHMLKSLMAYTKDGTAYMVDTRLRPEGSKGPLVNSLAALREYYLKNAHTWELQALLKARPLSVDWGLARRFVNLRHEVLLARGPSVTIADIRRMRERIQHELSRDSTESGIFDIKLGPGGLEELEFMVQYLQMKHCRKHPSLLVPATLDALRRLAAAQVLNSDDVTSIRETYLFYRTIETLLRLRGETVLRADSPSLHGVSRFMAMTSEQLISFLRKRRRWMSRLFDGLGND